jgi:hypothetical protein
MWFSFKSRDLHRHVTIPFLGAVDAVEHFLRPVPEEFLDGRGKGMGGYQPIIPVLSDTNPSPADDL